MKPNSILIACTGALDEIVMTTPLARSLRRTWPAARICWVVQPEWQALLAGHPVVDEVLIWPHDEWRARLGGGRLLALSRGIRDFRRQLVMRDFDLGIDAQGSPQSAWLLWLSGAKRRVGLESTSQAHWLMHESVPSDVDQRRSSDRYRGLAQKLRLDAGDFRPELALSDAQRRQVDALRVDSDLTMPYLLFCPFSAHPQKRWPAHYWSELLRGLHASTGSKVVILGDAGNRDSARRIIEGAGETAGKAARNLAGQTDLAQSMGLIAESRLIVSVDSGYGHMGIAFDRPQVLLFGPTRPFLHPSRENARVIFHDMACAPCGDAPTCGGAYTCMKELDVGTVAGHALRRLET